MKTTKTFTHFTLSVVTGKKGTTKQEFILLDFQHPTGMIEKEWIKEYGEFGNFRKSRVCSTATHSIFKWMSSKSSIYYIELW